MSNIYNAQVPRFLQPQFYGNFTRTPKFFKANQATRTGNAMVQTVTQRKRKFGSRSFSLKKAIDNTKPAKHCPATDITTGTGTCTHNTIYTWGPSELISKGTGDDQRIGDHVQLEALKLHYKVESNAAYDSAVQFRIITCFSGEEFNVPATLGSGLAASELFVTGASAWQVLGVCNPKAVTVLDDRTINLNNSITAVSDLESCFYTVRLGTKLDYQTAGSIYGKLRNLYVVVIASIDGGTTGTTVAGNILINADLIFK